MFKQVTKTMEKIKITENVELEHAPCFEVNIESDPEINIDYLIEWLDIVKSLGATHLEIGYGVYGGGLEELSLSPKKVRLETDEEFNVRVSKKALDNMVDEEKQKVYDIQEFTRLKNKLKL